MKLGPVRHDTRCAVCWGTMKKVKVVSPCLHRFCAKCIEEHIRKLCVSLPARESHRSFSLAFSFAAAAIDDPVARFGDRGTDLSLSPPVALPIAHPAPPHRRAQQQLLPHVSRAHPLPSRAPRRPRLRQDRRDALRERAGLRPAGERVLRARHQAEHGRGEAGARAGAHRQEDPRRRGREAGGGDAREVPRRGGDPRQGQGGGGCRRQGGARRGGGGEGGARGCGRGGGRGGDQAAPRARTQRGGRAREANARRGGGQARGERRRRDG